MNDYKLKVEIFKFNLVHKPEKVSDPSFRDLFNIKYAKDEEISDNELLKRFNSDLSKKLDNNGAYIEIGKKAQKAFSILQLPNINSKTHITYGVLKGGYKGKNKTSSDFEDKTKDESLDGKVINNEHFFMIYTPLENKVGFLIFQSYPKENIRIDFATFLVRNIFKHDKYYLNMNIEPFLPKQIKDDFQNGSVVSQITFTDNIPATSLSSSKTLIEEPKDYRVKVIIEPVGDGKLSVVNFDKRFLNKIKKLSALKKPLSKFKKTTGKIKKGGQQTPFTLNGMDEILPILKLESDYLDKNEKPDYDKIRKYCLSLLDKIIDEFYKKTKSKLIE